MQRLWHSYVLARKKLDMRGAKPWIPDRNSKIPSWSQKSIIARWIILHFVFREVKLAEWIARWLWIAVNADCFPINYLWLAFSRSLRRSGRKRFIAKSRGARDCFQISLAFVRLPLYRSSESNLFSSSLSFCVPVSGIHLLWRFRPRMQLGKKVTKSLSSGSLN